MLSCVRKIEQKARSTSSDNHSGDTFLIHCAHYLFLFKSTHNLCCKKIPLQKKKIHTHKY